MWVPEGIVLEKNEIVNKRQNFCWKYLASIVEQYVKP